VIRRQWLLLKYVAAGVIMLFAAAGCDEQSAAPTSHVNRSQPPAPAVPRPEPSPGAPSVQDRGAPSQGNAAAAQPNAAPAADAPPQFCARLSAGTAVPQSLPTGTAMGMSVDYTLLSTLPTSVTGTFWVIESAQGATANVPVQLQAQGNLMTFVTDMRPDDGPFHSYLAMVLADGRKVPISARTEMRAP
jgi:hypothetical protein